MTQVDYVRVIRKQNSKQKASDLTSIVSVSSSWAMGSDKLEGSAKSEGGESSV